MSGFADDIWYAIRGYLREYIKIALEWADDGKALVYTIYENTIQDMD